MSDQKFGPGLLLGPAVDLVPLHEVRMETGWRWVAELLRPKGSVLVGRLCHRDGFIRRLCLPPSSHFTAAHG